MQCQLQCEYVERPATPPLMSLLTERHADTQYLAAPYTVMAKLGDHDIYHWFAFSLGRPRNAVWGQIQHDQIIVEAGCQWTSLAMLNTLLTECKDCGYVVVSTLACNRITQTMLANLISNACRTGRDFEICAQRISYNIVISRLEELAEDQPKLHLTTLIDMVAAEFAATIADKNVAQYIPLNHDVPPHIIDIIHDYIEHNVLLSSTNITNSYGSCIFSQSIL